MLRITRVDIVDDWTLDIELSNGHLILFDTRRLLETAPGYGILRKNEVLTRPRTDGQNIFWQDGPRLTLEEIMALLNRQGDNER
ncbi:Protein of unknown function (DUF2442) [Desulfosporosinus orientis DSM 765]|uniref:DUF2442 domain-containing protein n=1 Tax=Desulfosporosinus orientis (strain ATCC 19365 / DSM 765 / NCIMB 8382 / VKM B-1628 / Singapore I) TaxID=768706 RepID=G7WBA2_DESOD|nr:hypothetical protein [Desulfosporosinus orientis]AET67883.1 Protein of unknown function (DUF2442) [Desulfosporosinus orientis DSM 765]